MPNSQLLVAVASHKPYWMPDDACYQPVLVGAASGRVSTPDGWVTDDAYPGNLSAQNPKYCELTALHWLWQQTQTPNVGLAHYRRYFARGYVGAAKSRICTGDDLLGLLERAPLVLPKPRHYVIETNYSQYAHAHHAKDLDTVRTLLAEWHPHMVESWDASMERRTGHRFNMFAARREVFEEWCVFLFPLLAELDERIDTTGYTNNDKRVLGFLSERLLDPWVAATGTPYVEAPVANLESQHWPTKAFRFVQRKVAAR